MSGGGTVVLQESWYAYDKLNRVSVVNGALENGQVVIAKDYRSYGLSYDAAGNQVSFIGGTSMSESHSDTVSSIAGSMFV